MKFPEIPDNTHYRLERGDSVRFVYDKTPQSTRKFWTGGRTRVRSVEGVVSLIVEEGLYIEGRSSLHKFKDIGRITTLKDWEVGGIKLITPRCAQLIIEG